MSQEYAAGDLRNTGLALEHDREWDFELDRIGEFIAERDAELVGLQFPEGLKRRADAVSGAIESHIDRDIQPVVSGQPCYGACDIDMDLVRRTDAFIHFGHSAMRESDKILYVPLYSNVDPLPIVDSALGELTDPEENPDLGLVTTAQHVDVLDDVAEFLEDAGYTVHLRRGDERLSHEGQVLGCNYASADVEADQVLYVGGGKFHPVGLAMEHPDKHVVIADPVNNSVSIADAEQFMRKRFATVHAAMDAETWGVLYCTKIGQGRWEAAIDIVEDNEKAMLITMDEITPDRLKNFDVDAFVNTGCPRITTDDGPQFDHPMVTPHEYEIAIGNEPLESLSFDTFSGTW